MPHNTLHECRICGRLFFQRTRVQKRCHLPGGFPECFAKERGPARWRRKKFTAAQLASMTRQCVHPGCKTLFSPKTSRQVRCDTHKRSWRTNRSGHGRMAQARLNIRFGHCVMVINHFAPKLAQPISLQSKEAKQWITIINQAQEMKNTLFHMGARYPTREDFEMVSPLRNWRKARSLSL